MANKKYRKHIRRGYLIFSLLIAVVFLGIGFSAFNNKLNISSSAGITPEKELNVYFTGDPVILGDGTVEASIDENNNRIINFSITGLSGYGDTSIIKYNIYNDSSETANLEVTASTTTNNTYFQVSSNINEVNSVELAPHESTTLVIVVKVKKVLASSNTSDKIEADASVVVHASAA